MSNIYGRIVVFFRRNVPMIISPDDYVFAQVKAYPCLFNGPSLHEMRMKVFDQLFNVIGNGIHDGANLQDAFKSALTNMDPEFNHRLLGGERLYTGYAKVITYMYETIQRTIPDTMGPRVTVFEMDKPFHPDMKVWKEEDNEPFSAPYPNFDKEYSLIYKVDLSEHGLEWIDAAIWFYEECRCFFRGPNVSQYHDAFPCETPEKTLRCIEDYQNALTKYTSYDAITNAYGVEYRGDIEDFILRRWTKTLGEIYVFLDEALQYLHDKRHSYTTSTPLA